MAEEGESGEEGAGEETAEIATASEEGQAPGSEPAVVGTGVTNTLLVPTAGGIRIQILNPQPLSNSWVYWRAGGVDVLLRTDRDGWLFSAPASAERTHPWEYTSEFRAAAGSAVEIYYSRGAKPIPITLLNANPRVFLPRTVAATIDLPSIHIQMTRPEELTIWPLLWELPGEAYHTDGLLQGAGIWVRGQARPVPGNQTLGENDIAPPLSANVRPMERGMRVEGTIDPRAISVKLQILDNNGNPVQMRPGYHATTGVAEINCTLGQATNPGDPLPFQAEVFLLNALEAFGQAQIAVIDNRGMSQPIFMEAFSVHLCGLQIALVDDHSANPNGQLRGPLWGETDERIVIDFLASPQSDGNPPNAPISDQTRARRMVTYAIANHIRPLIPGGTNNVIMPQMPLWMAELQVVGLNRVTLEEMMHRRYFHRLGRQAGKTVDLSLVLEWELRFSWDGPDSNSPSVLAPNERPNQFYSYNQTFSASQSVPLHFGDRGQFTDSTGQNITIGTGGDVPGAFDPAPIAIPFPVTGRRLPQVIVSDQSRPWGRDANAIQRQKEAIIIEYQPQIFDNKEVMRGGDGELVLTSISIDGQRIDGGLVRQDDLSVPPRSANPDISLPKFRIYGENPAPRTDVNALIDILVEEYYSANRGPRVDMLHLQCWQATARLIIRHESRGRGQFEVEKSGRYHYQRYYNGREFRMPTFGAPHGYGYAQLDNIFTPARGANDDEVWSFVENIRTAVRVIMDDKAGIAYNHLTIGVGATAFNTLHPTRRRAMYQREIVRRYNGTIEFRFENGVWVIHTTAPSDRRNYPNEVLGTTPPVTYPRDTAFASAQFGPGTNLTPPPPP